MSAQIPTVDGLVTPAEYVKAGILNNREALVIQREPVTGWKGLREFTLSREQFRELTHSQYFTADGSDDDYLRGEIMEKIDDAVWPFDDFGILCKEMLPKVRLTIHVSRDRLGNAAIITLFIWHIPLNVMLCSTVVPMKPYCNEDRQRSGLFMQVNESVPLSEVSHFLQARFLQSQQPLLCVVNLCYALMSSDVALQVIPSSLNRQQRRTAEREGRAEPDSTYQIVIQRRNVALRDVVKDAAEGKRLKPGFPVRRHRVNEFQRVRLGKIENVRSHQRGGKPGPGPGYLLKFLGSTNQQPETDGRSDDGGATPPV